MRKARLGIITTVIAICLFLTSCGGEKSSDNAASENKDETTKTEEQENAKDDEKTEMEGEKLETKLYNLVYNPEEWKSDEDRFVDEENRSVIHLSIPGETEDDMAVLKLKIKVEIAEPYEFRNSLHEHDFDEYEYAVNNSYETVNLGGVEFLKHDGETFGEPAVYYLAREEGANASIFVTVVGEDKEKKAEKVLSSLEFKLEDIGNEDCPWAWEGEAFTAEDKSAVVGNFNLSSHMLKFAEPLLTYDIFDADISIVGNKTYILHDKKIHEFDFDGETLTFVKELDLGHDFEKMSSTNDGSIWISSLIDPLIQVKDGVKVASYDDVEYVAMAPSGTWGVSYLTPECEKLAFESGAITKTPLDFSAQLSLISALMVDENHIYVCASAVGNEDTNIFIYNPNGELELILKEDGEGGSLGSVTYITETDNGYLALDGNMREVCLWAKDGTWIGSIKDGDLFSTEYPWFCSGQRQANGDIMVILTEEREDKSATEILVFKLSGF